MSKFSLLFIGFVALLILKLADVIAWSWWLVTLPLWIMPAWIVAFVVGCMLLAACGIGATVSIGLITEKMKRTFR